VTRQVACFEADVDQVVNAFEAFQFESFFYILYPCTRISSFGKSRSSFVVCLLLHIHIHVQVHCIHIFRAPSSNPESRIERCLL
jgi:hypothetical protein